MSNSSIIATNRRRVGFTAWTAAVATTLAGAAVALAPAAGASSNVLKYGTCSKGSVVSMQVQHSDPGLIEAGFEIDHAKVGSVWRVQLSHNRVRYFTGYRKPAAPDGTFSVDRVLRDLRGIDTVTGYARNLATGQVCTVTARI